MKVTEDDQPQPACLKYCNILSLCQAWLKEHISTFRAGGEFCVSWLHPQNAPEDLTLHELLRVGPVGDFGLSLPL